MAAQRTFLPMEAYPSEAFSPFGEVKNLKNFGDSRKFVQ